MRAACDTAVCDGLLAPAWPHGCAGHRQDGQRQDRRLCTSHDCSPHGPAGAAGKQTPLATPPPPPPHALPLTMHARGCCAMCHHIPASHPCQPPTCPAWVRRLWLPCSDVGHLTARQQDSTCAAAGTACECTHALPPKAPKPSLPTPALHPAPLPPWPRRRGRAPSASLWLPPASWRSRSTRRRVRRGAQVLVPCARPRPRAPATAVACICPWPPARTPSTCPAASAVWPPLRAPLHATPRRAVQQALRAGRVRRFWRPVQAPAVQGPEGWLRGEVLQGGT